MRECRKKKTLPIRWCGYSHKIGEKKPNSQKVETKDVREGNFHIHQLEMVKKIEVLPNVTQKRETTRFVAK